MTVEAEEDGCVGFFVEDRIEHDIATDGCGGFDADASVGEGAGDFGVTCVDALPDGGSDAVFISDTRKGVEAEAAQVLRADFLNEVWKRFANADGEAGDTCEGGFDDETGIDGLGGLPGDELGPHEGRGEQTAVPRGDVFFHGGLRTGAAGGENKGHAGL